MKRYIMLNIYRSQLGDCTNSGISSRTDHIYIEHPEGYIEGDVDPQLIFYPEKRGEEYWAVKPINQPKNMNGPMDGGNLAYSHDSRCERVYHIHDRFEHWDRDDF